MSRVLLVGRAAPERGGIPTYLQTLLASDLADRHHLTLLNQARGDLPQGGRLTAGNLRRLVRDAAELWRASRGQDIVHLHTALAPGVTVLRAGLLAAVARARGCRVVVHAHGGLLLLWMRSAGRRCLVRLACVPAHRVLTVSSQVQQALEQALGAPVLLVDNGVDTERFAPAPEVPEGDPRLLYVGLLTPRKGVLDLLEASRLLLQDGVAHELLLVGGTPSEGASAEQEVRRAASGSAARFLGERQAAQMPGVYREAHLFCLPSWYEAMPLSVLEAMASGLPVVASAVGDVHRVVQPNTTGALVPARDPVALAAALRPLLLDPERRRVLAHHGRRLVVDAFSSTATARVLSHVYDEETSAR